MKNICFSFVCILCACLLLCPAVAYATEDERRSIPVESNAIEDWPQGPVTGARAAIVLEVETGVILYAKDIHARLYPASTTKLMTCLVALENARLNDIVNFSYTAVDAVPADGSRIGIEAGEALTMEQALYGIMVGSGNEVANAVAEHVAGSMDAFVDLMNQRAQSLGLQDTHFTNANGLHDPDHYTSAYDLAVIASAFFDSVALSRIGGTPSYHFTPTATQPDDFWLRNKHRLITGEVFVEGVIGGKTGFTDEAGECLVTCAQREGMKLVSVVLFEDSPSQFIDSQSLLEYGFHNFSKITLAGKEETVFPSMPAFFLPERNLFERPVTTLSFAQGDALILPAGAAVADLTLSVAPPAEDAGEALAVFSYDWNGIEVGDAHVFRDVSEPFFTGRALHTRYIDLRIGVLVLLFGALIASTAVTAAHRTVIYFFGKESRRRRRNIRRRKRNSRM
ncbi:MAG: D-alanyl-D-alanine carboxypeptidase [Lachnospiraceae bacterium]|nr:D-alanyl-D-alanine carboxypeptidase [Lachnospiraceae bacterium]